MRWLDDNSDAWLEYAVGDVPLLLTFAHAGQRLVQGIEGRNETEPPENTHDTRTRDVAEAILLHMDWRGLRPYMIVPQVSRREVDLNRAWRTNQDAYSRFGVSVSAQNKAQEIHAGFYDQIQSFINDIRSRFIASASERALLIDIHGISLPDDIDIEIGTRDYTSADAAIVYTSTLDSTVTLMDALQTQGFAIRFDAATREKLNGVTVLEVNGRGSGGLHAVQLELSQPLRGSLAGSDNERREFARQTGVRLALALENFLLSNGYPILRNPPVATNDDDVYAAIML
jgi:N-formylglutamate amidohydrolase